VVKTQHISTHRRSETAATSDAPDRLAKALRGLINEANQAPWSGSVQHRRLHEWLNVPKCQRKALIVARGAARNTYATCCRSARLVAAGRHQSRHVLRAGQEGELSLVKIAAAHRPSGRPRQFHQPKAVWRFRPQMSCPGHDKQWRKLARHAARLMLASWKYAAKHDEQNGGTPKQSAYMLWFGRIAVGAANGQTWSSVGTAAGTTEKITPP
jgi:hypothetical protein